MAVPAHLATPIIADLPKINDVMMTWARQRLAAMGEIESGLLHFYASRVNDHGSLFDPYDVSLIEEILTRRGDFAHYVEAGPGVGQTMLALAVLGKSVIGVEASPRRFAALSDLTATMIRAFPEIAGRVRLENGPFPAFPTGGDWSDSLFYAGCFTFATNTDQDEIMVEGLRRFGASIIDLTRFVLVRRTPELLAGLRDLLRRKGFAEPEPIASPSGEFVFLRPLPRS